MNRARVLIDGLAFVIGFFAGIGAFAICTFGFWYATARIIMEHIHQ